MDEIYEVNKKAWISKVKVNIGKLVCEKNELLQKYNFSLESQIDSSYKDLNDKLNTFAKSTEKEVKPYFLFNLTDEKSLTIKKNCNLESYRLQLEHAKRLIVDREYKVKYLMSLETTRQELLMRHLASMNRQAASESTNNSQSQINECDSNAQTFDNIQMMSFCNPSSIIAIFVIQVWPQPEKNTQTRLEREIIFRQDQCLTSLRDQIKCQRDYDVPMDLSEFPEGAERIFQGEMFKSGFFLIGQTFYNDMRDPNNIDLSAGIIDWSLQKIETIDEDGKSILVDRGFESFKQARMEESTFEDLEFRLGCPYLYQHQGDCEHLFTISDIRYIQADVQQTNRIKYPFVTATSVTRRSDNLKCFMCKSRPPHWYTRKNNRLPVDPFFFCESCFYTFNYDSQKRKIGQFEAYLYTTNLAIPESASIAGRGK